MKKLFTMISLFLLAGLTLSMQAGNYTLDQNKIDAMFSQAEQTTTLSVFDLPDSNALPGPALIMEEKNATMAFILCWVVGFAGVHRLYLGTETMVFILYLITGGGCGVILLIDWIYLLMVMLDKGELTPFIDNPNFIMWKGMDLGL